MRRRVVVTGIGLVTPLGHTATQTWHNLIHGASGIVALGPEYADLPCRVGGRVPLREQIKDNKQLSLATLLALEATEEALQDASLTNMTDSDKLMTGVCIGSG